MSNLTEDQLKLIEEKRQKALKLKQQKNASPKGVSSSNVKNTHQNFYTKHSNNSSPTKSFTQQKDILIKGEGNKKLQCTFAGDGRILVKCDYNPKLISVFKSIRSRRYDPNTKGWTFLLADFDQLENKVKCCGLSLESPSDAVLVNTPDGSGSAVRLNNCPSDLKTAKCYLISRSRFEIDVPFDADCVGLFKTISSKSYNMTTRKWSFDLSSYNQLYTEMKRLTNIQTVPLSSTVLAVFQNQICGKTNFSISNVADSDLAKLNHSLVLSLMPFQKEGVKFAISRKGRILLADDMGLGKTVQSICIASYFLESWPLLVVCPSSVRLMWKEALLKWLSTELCEEDINIFCTSRDVASGSLISIISYDLLTKLQKEFVDKNFQIAIIDESHFIKNFKAARTRAVSDVVKKSKHLILLSGTPALSRPVELFTQLTLLRRDLFPRFQQFGFRYCDAKQTPWGWEYSGSSNMEELKLILEETVMLRRTKDDVLAQLPPKVRRSVAIDVGNSKKSAKLKESFEKAHRKVEKKGLSGVERHGALLQFFSETAHVKLPSIKSYVLDLLEGGRKFVLFAHHKIVLDSLQVELEKKDYEFMRIDGNTSSDKRQSEVARFQEKSSCKVALLSITAANMGINLHAASLVVFAELFWNPGILVQAEDRCYRIGQRDVVNVHYLVGKGTSDDYVWEMVKKKLSVLSQAGLNKSNFDDTENHEMKMPVQNIILNYFQAQSNSGKSKIDDFTSKRDLSITDDELLQLFGTEHSSFEAPDDDVVFKSQCERGECSSNGASSSYKAKQSISTDCSAQKRSDNLSEADCSAQKRSDNLSEADCSDDDLIAVSKWKRKKKRH